jgi:hypothetical protein
VLALRDYPLLLLVIVAPILCGIVEIGFRIAKRRGASASMHEQLTSARDQAGLLLSLVLGFTLSLALTRYDLRIQLIVEESNAIGTTRLRAGMLPEPARSEALRVVDEYARSRLDFAKAGLDPAAQAMARARSSDLQRVLWADAEDAARLQPTQITALFVESLNDMIDLDEKRVSSLENRVPRAVWVMIAVLALLTSLLIGLGMRRRAAWAQFVPPFMFAVVALLIADLDAPGKGLIRGEIGALVRVVAGE